MDVVFDALYRTEQKLGTLMSLFCGLAIFITCIGLLGLMTFMITRRTKEIGIRKIMGASAINIATLLSKDFLRLVVIAIVIAMPLAWYFMNQWMQAFKFRIEIGWELFAMSMLSGLALVIITVSYHGIKAAYVNPVETLKHE
mgnify:CR=1 FL=1